MLTDSITRYRCLLEISNAIITQHTREHLFKSLAQEIKKLFHYDRFSINLYDEGAKTLSYFAVADGIQPQEITCDTTRPLESASIAHRVIKTKKALVIRDMAEFTHFPTAQAMKAAGLKSTMAFPLVMRDKILGTIHFSFREPPEDLVALRSLIEDLSLQVTIAVDNMLSYKKLEAVNRSLEREKRYLQDRFEKGAGQFCYASPGMAKIMTEIELVAGTDASVLITGETGTGKDHIARYVHYLSPRRDRLFVKVNCAALSPTLVESELFGHAKGAFTGATGRRAGRFEMANGGTIFLDEVGELPLSTQAKLLQVVQERLFERVGESTPISVDIRVLSASNADLKEKLQTQEFRRDLFYRLNTIHIHLPPLRERLEDVPMLVNHFSGRYCKRMRRPEPRFSQGAIKALCNYGWPGNVRELENLLERIVILKAGQEITESAIRHLLDTHEAAESGAFLTKEEMEKRHIEKALFLCGGTTAGPKGAARLLNVPRSTLQYRIRKLGIDVSAFVSPAGGKRTG